MLIVKGTAGVVTAGGVLLALTGAGLAGLPTPSVPSTLALSQVPASELAADMRAAQTCPGLDWTVLAAITHLPQPTTGRPVPAATAGPLRTAPSDRPTNVTTARSHGTANDTVREATAIATVLCRDGAAHDLRQALLGFRCPTGLSACEAAADSWVRQVLAVASTYRRPDTQPAPAATVALDAALDMLGTPYRWGGDNPGGFDCSGLTQWAYAQAGIPLPRTAQAQYDHGPWRSDPTLLVPGDLLFFGAGPTSVDHTGLYLGEGLMIDAPHTGSVVRIDQVAGFIPPLVGSSAPVEGT